MVLLKGFDADGFVFFTNFESAKGRELARQSEGGALLPLEEPPPPGARARAGDAGHAGRGRRLFRHAPARQPHRRLGEPAVAAAGIALRAGEGGRRLYTAKYRPRRHPAAAYWSGFRLAPVEIEFWQDGAFRLHDRIVFTRGGEGWEKTRLYP